MCLSYIGGKSRIAPKLIIPNIPKDIENFVEVFGGMFWTFFSMDLKQYPNLKKVIYNDINPLNHNLFQCVKNPQLLLDAINAIPCQQVGVDVTPEIYKEQFVSFQAEILKRLHVIDKTVPYALLATRWHKKHVIFASETGCSQLNVAHHSLSPSAVDFTHKQGLKVGAYTVNEVLRAQQLKEQGVDAIFTDDVPLITKGLQAP